jgi:hypothetical protein
MGLFSLWRRERPKPARLLDHPILRELPLSEPGRPIDDAPALPPAPPVVRELPPPPALADRPRPEQIRQLLLVAAASNDEDRLACLCRDHESVLQEHLPDWLDVPPDLRASPEAARWYADGVRAVARFCADRLGRPDLLRRLEANRTTPADHESTPDTDLTETAPAE